MPDSGIMGTMVGGISVREYIDMIRRPLYALIGLAILDFLVSFTLYAPGLGFGLNPLAGSVSALVSLLNLLIGCYIGYLIVRNYSGDLLNATAAGAIAGVIVGFVSAVLSLIMVAMGFGAIYGYLSAYAITGAVIGLITTPIVSGILGGLLGAFGGLVAGARTFGPQSATVGTSSRTMQTRAEYPKQV